MVVAESRGSFRVLETSHPPVYYLPAATSPRGALACARAQHLRVQGSGVLPVGPGRGAVAEAAGWTYPEPMPGFEVLRDTIALYPGRMDSCTVDGEVVEPQPGDFYGGWITSRVVGPFKGRPARCSGDDAAAS